MEGALSLLFGAPIFSSKPNSSFNSLSPLIAIPKCMVSSKPSNKTLKENHRIPTLHSGMTPVAEQSRKKKTHHLNLEVSPHRAGRRRAVQAQEGIAALRENVDTLIVIPNDKLLIAVSPNTPVTEAFNLADDIVRQGVRGISDIITNVKLAKIALRPGAGNFVNGILRKLVSLKETNSLPLPKIEGDDRAQARALAIIHSHPVWMVRRWTKFLGQEEAVRIMNWNNSSPSFSLRVNTGKGYTRADLVSRLKTLKVPHELSAYMDDFVRVQTGLQIVIQAGLLREGLCSVQDESAGLVVSVLDPQPGETIIDCCAAPGGKTLFIASRLRGQGKVLAIDINEGRLRILKEAAKLHNVDGVITAGRADLRLFSEKFAVISDKVLLDAPCSGLGVLSKRADLRWNRTLEDLEQMTLLQDELLDAASKLVKPGGILVYSTCTIDPEENEERIAAFLLRHPEFAIDPVDGHVPSNFVTENGFYYSNPIKHSIDGSFAARLIRSF